MEEELRGKKKLNKKPQLSASKRGSRQAAGATARRRKTSAPQLKVVRKLSSWWTVQSSLIFSIFCINLKIIHLKASEHGVLAWGIR
ncbi:hypothetical protein BJP34_15910 [Moorena producens PAL-8-15-08-1]|uniref:Uncharacterized protein n=1 Tax=Moorena producens PAL-8-15-08-1 TaxID=1458985 RepID=A0A1D8TSW4_9CYAN|nr:hypothetical protein BJP34_15910 [Moorena producens PAL-8-15-08-1]